MTRLGHFALGAVVAAMLTGPTAWAEAKQVARHGAASVAQTIDAPAPHIRAALVAVRSALLPTTP
jgi:hypothetical protein